MRVYRLVVSFASPMVDIIFDYRGSTGHCSTLRVAYCRLHNLSLIAYSLMEFQKCHIFEPHGQTSRTKKRKAVKLGLNSSWYIRHDLFKALSAEQTKRNEV